MCKVKLKPVTSNAVEPRRWTLSIKQIIVGEKHGESLHHFVSKTKFLIMRSFRLVIN